MKKQLWLYIFILSTFLNANYLRDANFSDDELKIYKYIIKDDLNMLVNSNDSLFSEKINHIIESADSIQKEYEKNEIYADEKYKNKILIINAKIESINKDIFNNPYLSLYGGNNQFINPQAKFKSIHNSWLVKLSKNQKVKIVCESSNLFGGITFFNNCMPAFLWVDNTTEKIVNNDKYITKDEFINLSKVVKNITSKLSKTSKCFSENQINCSKEINKILEKIK